ncbi:MAG: hypothetical protein ACP5N1_02600 [Candidatus Woesearchaeota archaeon]
MNPNELKKLHTNQRLVVCELIRRGVEIRLLSAEMELLEAKYGNHKELLLDRDSSINPYSSSIVCSNKQLTKRLLKESNISVTESEEFNSKYINYALTYAQSLGFPIVIKPLVGSHGDNVHVGLENLIEVKNAIDSIVRQTSNTAPFIIEEHFDGFEYRVFITKENKYAVLHRDPAHIIGDGKNTIDELIKLENYNRTNPRKNCLSPIIIDDVATNYLTKKNLTLKSIPEQGIKTYLRNTSNIAKGGVCEDYTDKIHPSVIEISRKALDIFPGLPFAGIDFMSEDITIQQTSEIYRILEVNANPGVHMHMRPGVGQSRDVAKYIVDIIFPETRGYK